MLSLLLKRDTEIALKVRGTCQTLGKIKLSQKYGGKNAWLSLEFPDTIDIVRSDAKNLERKPK